MNNQKMINVGKFGFMHFYCIIYLYISFIMLAINAMESTQSSLFKKAYDEKTGEVAEYVLMKDLIPFMGLRAVDKCNGSINVPEKAYNIMQKLPSELQNLIMHTYGNGLQALKKSYATSYNNRIFYSVANDITALEKHPTSDALLVGDEKGNVYYIDRKKEEIFECNINHKISSLCIDPVNNMIFAATEKPSWLGCYLHALRFNNKKESATVKISTVALDNIVNSPIIMMDLKTKKIFSAGGKRLQEWKVDNEQLTLTCVKRWDARYPISFITHMNDNLFTISDDDNFPLSTFYIQQWEMDTYELKKTTPIYFPIRSVLADSNNNVLIMGHRGGLCEWNCITDIVRHTPVLDGVIKWFISNNKKYPERPIFSSVVYDAITHFLLALDTNDDHIFMFDRDTFDYIYTHNLPSSRILGQDKIVIENECMIVSSYNDLIEFKPSFDYIKAKTQYTWEQWLLLESLQHAENK